MDTWAYHIDYTAMEIKPVGVGGDEAGRTRSSGKDCPIFKSRDRTT